MAKLYGVEDGSRVLSSIFGGPKKLTNEVTPVAQKLCAYLARKIDADGGTTCIYWAVGMGGSEIEVVGDLTAVEAERHTFGPPQEFGTGTQLLPAVRYFVDRFRTAPWGFYVFITDGELHDLDEVKAYSVQLAREVSAGRRKPLKFVLIGLGPNVNETQMVELDDLDSGTEVDLWDHKLAAEMRSLAEIFAEVVDKNTRVADNGRILDSHSRVLREYFGGLPAYIEFEAPADSDYFVVEVNGVRITQPLSDQVRTPVTETRPAAPARAPAAPAAPTVPLAKPVAPAPPAPAEPEPVEALETTDDSEWRDLPLEMAKPGEEQTNLDLDKPKDD
jgi:hypothetical protein